MPCTSSTTSNAEIARNPHAPFGFRRATRWVAPTPSHGARPIRRTYPLSQRDRRGEAPPRPLCDYERTPVSDERVQEP